MISCFVFAESDAPSRILALYAMFSCTVRISCTTLSWATYPTPSLTAVSLALSFVIDREHAQPRRSVPRIRSTVTGWFLNSNLISPWGKEFPENLPTRALRKVVFPAPLLPRMMFRVEALKATQTSLKISLVFPRERNAMENPSTTMSTSLTFEENPLRCDA